MKRVLFVCIDSPGYNSDGMAAAFKEVGFRTVIRFNWQQHRFNFGILGVRQKMIELAIENAPDLIFLHIQNREILDEETAKELQSIAPTVNYTFDVRENIDWYKKVAPYIAHTFFACDDDVWSCKIDDINNVSCIQSSCDYSWYRKLPLPKKQTPEVVFIGNNYENTRQNFEGAAERQRMIEFLYDNLGDRFAAYGLGQKNGMVNPQQEINIYNQSRIAICQNLMYRISYVSDRIWRIMGTGCFCLTKKFEGIENIFQKEVHLDWWKTFNELESLIEFYLFEEKEREAIAQIGTNYVRENHTWAHRWKKVLEVIKF